MTTKLFVQAITKFLLGIVLAGVFMIVQFFERELTGYRKHIQRVKYRRIPFIWQSDWDCCKISN